MRCWVKPKLVTVEWIDTIESSGWDKAEEVNPPTLWTTGWLILQTDKVVKLANTRDEKGDYYGIHAFPVGCVVSITPPKKTPSKSFSV
jgi:hypothetical protein